MAAGQHAVTEWHGGSACSTDQELSYRASTACRVWLQQDDVYYVMFERNSPNGDAEPRNSDAEEAGPPDAAAEAAPAAAEAEPAAVTELGTAATTAAVAAAASAAPAAAAEQQPAASNKQRRKWQRADAKKKAAAAAADGDEAAAAASRRRFNRVRIDEFPVASDLICAIMPLLRKELVSSPVLKATLFQVRAWVGNCVA